MIQVNPLQIDPSVAAKGIYPLFIALAVIIVVLAIGLWSALLWIWRKR